MTGPQSVQMIPKPGNIMLYVGGLMLAGLLVYFSFSAVNSMGLQNQSATARVIGKGFQEAGKTYVTQRVGNRMLTVPQVSPEMYLLELDVQGKTTSCAVAKAIYDRVNAGDPVSIVFHTKRITRGIQVLSVLP